MGKKSRMARIFNNANNFQRELDEGINSAGLYRVIFWLMNPNKNLIMKEI